MNKLQYDQMLLDYDDAVMQSLFHVNTLIGFFRGTNFNGKKRAARMWRLKQEFILKHKYDLS